MFYNIPKCIHEQGMDSIFITFCCVSSHCGITSNKTVDKTAKYGAQNLNNTTNLNIRRDAHELIAKINNYIKENYKVSLSQSNKAYTTVLAFNVLPL